jgi:mRNA interferase MazF
MDFSPHAGREQAGRRPALVLTPKKYNALVGVALVCPISSKQKAYPFEVMLASSIETRGVVLADQVRCFAWKERRAKFKETAPHEVLEEVLSRLSALLDS